MVFCAITPFIRRKKKFPGGVNNRVLFGQRVRRDDEEYMCTHICAYILYTYVYVGERIIFQRAYILWTRCSIDIGFTVVNNVCYCTVVFIYGDEPFFYRHCRTYFRIYFNISHEGIEIFHYKTREKDDRYEITILSIVSYRYTTVIAVTDFMTSCMLYRMWFCYNTCILLE